MKKRRILTGKMISKKRISYHAFMIEVCQEYDLGLVFMSPSYVKQYDFVNRSCAAMPDEIMIGSYDDPELELISFFHELGHCVDLQHRNTKYEQEKAAWEIGLTIAEDEGIQFSQNAFDWASRQLKSYDQLQYHVIDFEDEMMLR